MVRMWFDEHVHELLAVVGDDAHDDVEAPGADAHVVDLRQLGHRFGDRLQARRPRRAGAPAPT